MTAKSAKPEVAAAADSAGGEPVGEKAADDEATVLEALASALVATTKQKGSVAQDVAKKVAVDFDEKIQYCATEANFLAAAKAKLCGNIRLVVLVDAATSRVKVNSEMLEIASQLVNASGCGQSRVVVCVNRRFDLMAKVSIPDAAGANRRRLLE
jgi:hypothetical protein